ncbi:MAG: hypothetical protein U9R20_02475, partial [Thermodesulfobacteriota bacterium]|nr:hypothetical protein [Thermodesulfobacteriota bacterium]
MRENKNITLAIQGIIDPQFANYKRRIQYVADVFMPFIDGIEIGFFSFQAGELANILLSDVTKEILREFKCNSIHVAQRPEQQVLREDIVCVMNMVNNLFSNGLVQTVSFHLDMAYLFELIAEQSDPGLNLLWENLGKDAHIGNTYDELTKAAIQYPEWGIVFDIAHAMEMESYGQPSLLEHFDTFKQRIRQVHFSWPGNLYSENQVGSDF